MLNRRCPVIRFFIFRGSRMGSTTISQETFATLYKDNYDLVRKIVARFRFCSGSQDDIVQEVF